MPAAMRLGNARTYADQSSVRRAVRDAARATLEEEAQIRMSKGLDAAWKQKKEQSHPRLSQLYDALIGYNEELGGPVTVRERTHCRPIVRLYLCCLVLPSQNLLRRAEFHIVSNVITIIAVIGVGLSTYIENPPPGFEAFADSAWDAFWYLDSVVIAFFMLEVVVRFGGKKFRPCRFFYDPFTRDAHGRLEGAWTEARWNIFDLMIVIFTTIPLILAPTAEVAREQQGGIQGFPPVLRLLRLARLLKIFKSVVQLQVILRGLGRGLQCVGYVVVMLLLVLYIFGVFAMIFFARFDPFAYPSLIETLVNLFRAATLEDWSDLMYVAYYGCDPQLGYPAGPSPRWMCHGSQASVPSGAQTFLAVAYWTLFVIVASFVMLSLFVGAITLGMQESVDEVIGEKKIAEEKKRQAARRRLQVHLVQSGKIVEVKRMWNDIIDTNHVHRTRKQLSLKRAAKGVGMRVGVAMSASKRGVRSKQKACQGTMSLTNPSNHPSSPPPSPPAGSSTGDDMNESTTTFARRLSHQIAAIEQQLTVQATDEPAGDASQRERRPLCCRWLFDDCTGAYARLALYAVDLEDTHCFRWMILLTILFAAVTVGLESEPSINSQQGFGTFADWANHGVQAIFSFEILVKVVACGYKPWEYFFTWEWYLGWHGLAIHYWNIFDFLIVFFGYIIGNEQSNLLPVLRLMRLLRVLKLMRALPQLHIIASALIDGLGSIFYIFMLMLMIIYLFANIGVILFQRNDPWHWGSLHVAAITLFRMSTLEDWSDIMYINMYGCVEYGYEIPMMERMCNQTNGAADVSGGGNITAAYPVGFGPGSSKFYQSIIFSISFVLLSALVLLSLFVGVVTTSMEAASAMQKKERAQQHRITELQEKYNAPHSRVKAYESIFKTFDADGSGTIDREEFKMMMACKDEDITDAQLEQWVVLVDENGDDEITFVEFAQMAMQMEYDGKRFMRRKESVEKHYNRVNQMFRCVDGVYDAQGPDPTGSAAANAVDAAQAANLSLAEDSIFLGDGREQRAEYARMTYNHSSKEVEERARALLSRDGFEQPPGCEPCVAGENLRVVCEIVVKMRLAVESLVAKDTTALAALESEVVNFSKGVCDAGHSSGAAIGLSASYSQRSLATVNAIPGQQAAVSNAHKVATTPALVAPSTVDAHASASDSNKPNEDGGGGLGFLSRLADTLQLTPKACPQAIAPSPATTATASAACADGAAQTDATVTKPRLMSESWDSPEEHNRAVSAIASHLSSEKVQEYANAENDSSECSFSNPAYQAKRRSRTSLAEASFAGRPSTYGGDSSGGVSLSQAQYAAMVETLAFHRHIQDDLKRIEATLAESMTYRRTGQAAPVVYEATVGGDAHAIARERQDELHA